MAAVSEQKTHQIIRALSSPVRREILWRVWNAERSAGAIAAGLDVSAPTVSEHLAILRDAGLIELRREGATRWYRARREVVARFRSLFDDSAKWRTALRHPEQEDAGAVIQSVVHVEAEALCPQEEAFDAFVDAGRYSAWIGGDVSIVDGRFTMELGFGPTVRGFYVYTCRPALIIMDWDFNFRDVPAPGASQRADLIIRPLAADRCRLEILQFISAPDQAEYYTLAWRYVLGRFAGHTAKSRPPA